MNRPSARLLVTVGTVGVLVRGTWTAVTVGRGHDGDGEALGISSCGPRTTTGTVVHVSLADGWGFMMEGDNLMMASLAAAPDSVPAGVVTFIATNVGALVHELLVMPAPRDGGGTRRVDAAGTIDQSRRLGEASTSCGRGAGRGISPGASSWVTLRLAPGNYELLCDIPWHYANGMFANLVVH